MGLASRMKTQVTKFRLESGSVERHRVCSRRTPFIVRWLHLRSSNMALSLPHFSYLLSFSHYMPFTIVIKVVMSLKTKTKTKLLVLLQIFYVVLKAKTLPSLLKVKKLNQISINLLHVVLENIFVVQIYSVVL